MVGSSSGSKHRPLATQLEGAQNTFCGLYDRQNHTMISELQKFDRKIKVERTHTLKEKNLCLYRSNRWIPPGQKKTTSPPLS